MRDEHYYNTPLYQRFITLCSNGQTLCTNASPVATMGHVAHAWLLLGPTAVASTLTSTDRCYYY
jgi:hypothetical protein